MRFLADESCDFRVVRAWRAAGHDVVAVAEVAAGAEDDAGTANGTGGWPSCSNGLTNALSNGSRRSLSDMMDIGAFERPWEFAPARR
jgi:hypothetical protein